MFDIRDLQPSARCPAEPVYADKIIVEFPHNPNSSSFDGVHVTLPGQLTVENQPCIRASVSQRENKLQLTGAVSVTICSLVC
jgi:hypothetical protein